jgi:hypothetical protein
MGVIAGFIVGGLLLSGIGGQLASNAVTAEEGFTALLVTGLGGCLLFVGLVGAGVRLGTGHLRPLTTSGTDGGGSGTAAPLAGPLGPPQGLSDDLDAEARRHGRAIAGMLARGEDTSSVLAELRRAFPSATPQQREGLLRRVEDQVRRSSV